MTLFVVVALTLAGLGVYCAYKDPKLGAALLVGIAILTVLWLVVERDTPTSSPTPESSSSSPRAVSSQEAVPSATESVLPRAPS
ncbi:hypothetical protein [Streptomyces murinus]|uniref:hypothetical protein n=1 Tax=Streptomyces murinus TaxID=33900 RepID=UPI0037F9B5C0